MYRSILVPVDGTVFGEHALPHAATLSRRCGATLHLAHVHEPVVDTPTAVEAITYHGEWNQVTRNQETNYLQRLADRLTDAFSIPVATQVMDGPVCEALESYAVSCGAGLVVMSSHRRTGLSRLWHHCTSEQLIHDLPIPVMLIRPEREDAEPDLAAEVRLRRILVPLDGSPDAETVLHHALGIGRGAQASYTLLRVIEPKKTLSGRLAGDEHESHHTLVREQTVARQYLSSIAERLRKAGVTVDAQVRVARDPGAAIVEYVRSAVGDESIDLIAMGSHEHRPISRLLATHTSDTVLREVPVPVLMLQQAPLTATMHDPEPMLSAE